MAKIYGLFGAMTGKVADVVMTVRNGEQIARKYQPVVANPNTPGQVQSRAKLKLMSQLSAVMAPYIAIPREGTVSPRNLFLKLNYKYSTFQNNQADVTLSSVKITKSVVGLPPINATRTVNTLEVSLYQAATGFSRIVYVAVFRQDDSSLRIAGSTVVTEPGTTNVYAGTIDLGTSAQLPIVVFAYGVRDNTEAARVKFADMTVDAQTIASVITSRALTEADVTLTETRAIEVTAQNREDSSKNSDDKNKTGIKK